MGSPEQAGRANLPLGCIDADFSMIINYFRVFGKIVRPMSAKKRIKFVIMFRWKALDEMYKIDALLHHLDLEIFSFLHYFADIP